MTCHLRLLRWWVGLGSILSAAMASFTTVRHDDSSWSRFTHYFSADRTTFTDYERSLPLSSSSFSEPATPLYYHSVPPETFGSTQPNDWKILCPPVWNSKQTKDVTIQWSCCEDPTAVATRLLQRLDLSVVPVDTTSSHTTGTTTSPLVMTLAQAMTYFRDFCFDNLNGPYPEDNHGFQFKCRLVTTRGSTGTKCPQWHTDHVPIRWIQAMVGPGCQWVVGNDGVDWTTMKNGFDDENQDGGYVRASVRDRNRVLVQDSVATIYSTHEQEAVLLLGNQWPKYAKHRVDTTTFKPVIHKSPTIPWGCGRVLFTQDVLFHED